MISPKEETIIDEDGCKVLYIRNFLSSKQESKLMGLLEEVPFRDEIIKMYGKEIKAPRKTFSFGDKGITYTYARKTEECEIWNKGMISFRDIVFSACKEHGDSECPFNFVLLNFYKNGNDYIGPHSDNEKDIIPQSMIASLSIGSPRQFNFYRLGKQTENRKISVTLESGSLLLMAGKTQELFKHELPKSPNVNEKRYNLTFRHLQ